MYHDEASFADNAEDTKVRSKEIKGKIATYNLSNVLNMDETGLFYRFVSFILSLVDYKLNAKGCKIRLQYLFSGWVNERDASECVVLIMCKLEPNHGKKLQKEWITVALTTNADGSTKLPPIVIQKYARPRAFTRRNISNPENLCILWNSNSKAWMTTILFEKFLLDFERRIRLA